MAARRLILVLAVLLGISIVAAAIAPERQSSLLGEDTTEESTTQPEPEMTAPEAKPSGELVETRIEADPEKPETIRVAPGDQLELQVGSGRPREIEIAEFGVLEPAEPDSPARFSLLLREAGELAITDAESGEILGRIIAAEEDPPKPEREPEEKPEVDMGPIAEPV
jgi:hypothetical protein